MLTKVPEQLRSRPQWVLWRNETRSGRPTKVPVSVSGNLAKSNDPTTWTTFEAVYEMLRGGSYDGLGYVFAADDPFCGIDLDGCRDPASGVVADWAREMLLQLNSYSEVSPSQTGVKVFVEAQLPAGKGRKQALDYELVGNKQPAVEMYDQGRYFTVTGQRLRGLSTNIEPRQEVVSALCDRLWPAQTVVDFHSTEAVIERARKYLQMLPPAVSGQSGHNATFHAACILVLGFGLERNIGLALLREWNAVCQPPWSDRELEHKIDSALKQPGERNYLRNATRARWKDVAVPHYAAPQPKHRPRITTLSEAMQNYVTTMQSGAGELIETGISELDYAIGGGLTLGELFVVAGRPSHGKSAIALQCAHHWTSAMLPTLIVTEEMSQLALGRRALLFTSDTPEEHWQHEAAGLQQDIEEYKRLRAECFVVESCQTMEVAEQEISRHVQEHQVRAVIVDYAQLLQSKGNARWEQMANTSGALRRLVSQHQIIVLALVQMNQDIEKRLKPQPKLSDLGDTGQWARDADVIVFAVWPHRFDYKLPANEYRLYVAKNRNRPINAAVVTCRFEPSRQRVVPSRVNDDPFEDESHVTNHQGRLSF